MKISSEHPSVCRWGENGLIHNLVGWCFFPNAHSSLWGYLREVFQSFVSHRTIHQPLFESH
jgi:hypothetical protein